MSAYFVTGTRLLCPSMISHSPVFTNLDLKEGKLGALTYPNSKPRCLQNSFSCINSEHPMKSLTSTMNIFTAAE